MSRREPPDPRPRTTREGPDERRDAAACIPAVPGASTAGGGAERPTRDAAGGGRPERRQETRREGRGGVGRRADERAAGSATSQRPTGDRRRERTLAEQREQWSLVSGWLRRHGLVEFRDLLERLAQATFGEEATVMPHLRRSHGRQYLVFVVDAASPEACANYDDFLPLERAFWTAYGTIPKPPSAFVVAIRPARGWWRSEALMPLFAQFQAPEHLT